MIEVEVKIPLHSRDNTENELIRLGFASGDLIRETDIYFTSDFHDFLKRDEALRIRRSENLTKATASAVLTFKGPKIDAVSMTRKEVETRIEDPAGMQVILLALGFREVIPVRKLRKYYNMDIEGYSDYGDVSWTVHACLDQVEGLGSFLELEMLVEREEDCQDALDRVEWILHELGYGLADTTRDSYLCMLMGLE